MKFFNRVRVYTPTTGAGDTIVFGDPPSNAYNTFAEAGANSGDQTTIVVDQGSDYAIYKVTIGANAEFATIDEVVVSKIDGIVGTTPLDLDGSAEVRCVESANDVNDILAAIGALQEGLSNLAGAVAELPSGTGGIINEWSLPPRLREHEIAGFIARPPLVHELVLGDLQPEQIEGDSDNPDNPNLIMTREALSQIAEYHSDMSLMSMVGDLIDTGYPNVIGGDSLDNHYDYSELLTDLQTLGNVPMHRFFPLPGNHDRSFESSATTQWGRSNHEYERWFGKSFYWTLHGNIVRIYMGDMGPDSPEGEYPDFVFEWFKSILEATQGKIRFMYTHHPPNGVGFGGGDFYRHVRFKDLIEKEPGYEVTCWFSGHTYNRGGPTDDLTDDHIVSHRLVNGVWYIQCGLHIADNARIEGFDPSWVKLTITDGSTEMLVRRWNVNTASYVPGKEFIVTLPRPAQTAADFAYDGRFAFDDRFGVRNYTDILAKHHDRFEYAPGSWGPRQVTWARRTAVMELSAPEDQLAGGNPQTQPGGGVGHLLGLAGSTATPNYETATYGPHWAGGYSLERTSGAENDFSSMFCIWTASYPSPSYNDGLSPYDANIKRSFISRPNSYLMLGTDGLPYASGNLGTHIMYGNAGVSRQRKTRTKTANNSVIASDLVDTVTSGGDEVTVANAYCTMISNTDGAMTVRWGWNTRVGGSFGARVYIQEGLYGASTTGGDKGQNTANFTDYYASGVRQLKKVLEFSETINFGTVAANGGTNRAPNPLAAPGVLMSDHIVVTVNNNYGGLKYGCFIPAADQINAIVTNYTSADINPGAAVITYHVYR